MLPLLRKALLAGLLAAPLAAPPAAAGQHEQEALRLAVGRGEIRPLSDILAGLRDQLPGDVIGVEVEEKKGSWQYELRVLDPGGRLYEVHVDARTGAIERVREK